MPIKLLPDGTVIADTATEMAEYAKLMRAAPIAATPASPARNGKAAPKPMGADAAHEIAASVSDWVIPSAIKMLTTISESSAPGADRDTIMRAMGIDDPKAFGGRSAAINKLLEKLGFQVNHVYEGVRNPQGKFWKGRAKLNEALATIRSISLL